MNRIKQSPMSFDDFAADYDAALEKGISVSGEDKDFFAKARVDWLASCLAKRNFVPRKILDFGCGTGSAIPYFVHAFPEAKVTGAEISSKSIEVAKAKHTAVNVDFLLIEELRAANHYDLVFCNGVFHHIPIPDRDTALKKINGCLRGCGLFAFWENNPWNPGTRIVMSRIPFDRDAQTLSPPTAKKMIQKMGFRILQADFRFYFPRPLAILRFTEILLTKVPLGAQYLILAEKSEDA